MNFLQTLFSLKGRHALVTGASRGIGASLAQGLAAAGAEVVGIGRSPRPESEMARVEYRSLDISDNEAVTALCATLPRLDILVNAAGISLPLGDESPETRFGRTLEINLTAAYFCCLTAAAAMKRNGGGSIINVTSIGSVLGFPGNPGYVAAKGGLRMLTRALAVDLGSDGIRVNNLAPGYVRTRMTEASFSDPVLNEQRRRHTCLGRWGEPADLVGAAIFLASDASAYVTGQDIFVDGGWTAKGMV